MILIIDGNNIAYRSFHTPQGSLTTKAGEPTGVMLGVLHSLKVYLDKFQNVDRVVVCWDGGKAAWRREIYPGYKATRTYGDDPEEKARYQGLFNQIDLLDEFLPNLGVDSIKIKGWEADDLIYAICKLHPLEDKVVVTTDKDMYQLVDNKTCVFRPGTEQLIGLSNFYDTIGVELSAYMGYRALRGDDSDNIPGVPGIGEKTGKSLMGKYGHIDNILGATGSDKAALLKSSRTSKIFEKENLEIIGRNHRIMNFKYVDYSSIESELVAKSSGEPEVNSKAVKDFLMRWQFVSILSNYMPFVLSFRTIGDN